MAAATGTEITTAAEKSTNRQIHATAGLLARAFTALTLYLRSSNVAAVRESPCVFPFD
jgi:hypothetical protein